MTFVKAFNPAAKTLDNLMTEIFNDFPSTYGKPWKNGSFNHPPVNIHENKDNYLLEIAIPGFEKTDFNINLEANLLTISSDKKEAEKGENEKLIRKEFSSKAFKRSFTLDEKIDAAAIDAKYENGILKLNLPKKEVAKEVTKQIAIQ